MSAQRAAETVTGAGPGMPRRAADRLLVQVLADEAVARTGLGVEQLAGRGAAPSDTGRVDLSTLRGQGCPEALEPVLLLGSGRI